MPGNVIKYGFAIGHAPDAAAGSWMHTHNVKTNLFGEVEYSYNPAPRGLALQPETFMGFRGAAGPPSANEIWIIPAVGLRR